MTLPDSHEPLAWFGGRLATGLVEMSSDPGVLDGGGWWAVLLTFEGDLTCARFTDVRPARLPSASWSGGTSAWASSLDRAGYVAAVEHVRAEIAEGEVYQVNVCRVLSASSARPEPLGLANVLQRGNPAPYAGVLSVPDAGIAAVSASPELFLRRDGDLIESGPIKGTGRTARDLTEKDRAENVMIVDLVRNDLGAVCRTGSIDVPRLCEVEQHPGLVHLVSVVRGRLRTETSWTELLGASFPPGSVSGAPKSSALRIIRQVEPVPRGPYCGAVGWVDADRREACLAVAIRSFWWDRGFLRFGTGAGITWASAAETEWQETELKAQRLIALASSGEAKTGGAASGGDIP